MRNVAHCLATILFLTAQATAGPISDPDAPDAGQSSVNDASSDPRASAPREREVRWYVRRLTNGLAIGGHMVPQSVAGDSSNRSHSDEEVSYAQVELASEDAKQVLAGIQEKARIALLVLSGGYVELQGGRIWLSGIAKDARSQAAAQQTFIDLPPGYQLVDSRIEVLPSGPYLWQARIRTVGEHIETELSGFVPDSHTRRLLVGVAKGLNPSGTVHDLMEIKEGAPDKFLEAARTLLHQLAPTTSGLVALSDRRADLVLEHPRRAQPDEICAPVQKLLPEGYSCSFAFSSQPRQDKLTSTSKQTHPRSCSKRNGRTVCTLRTTETKVYVSGKKTTVFHNCMELNGQRRCNAAVTQVRSTGEFRPEGPESAAAKALGDPRIVDLLYVTGRQRIDAAEGPTFTGERGKKPTLGVARVRIPDDHKMGRIELPWPGLSLIITTIFKETVDPKKHFIIQAKNVLTRAQWNDVIRSLRPTDALVFVHGFNTSFEEAVRRNAQIVWDLQYTGLPVLFSWPSRGNVIDYVYDKDSAAGARVQFIELIQSLQRDHGITKIHVLAHSMGNAVVLDALSSHSRTKDPVRIAELIMAAPDVDRDLFRGFVPELRQVVSGLTLYASSADKALVASKHVAGNIPRAGDVPGGEPIIMPGLESIDVTPLGSEMFGLNHSSFAETRPLLDDLGLIIREGKRAPRLSQIRPVPERPNPPRFWRVAP